MKGTKDMKSKKWTLWSLDVLGNEQEGYEVNDRYTLTRGMVIDDNASDQEILDMLMNCGYLIGGILLNEDVIIEWVDDNLINVYDKNMMPIFDIESN